MRFEFKVGATGEKSIQFYRISWLLVVLFIINKLCSSVAISAMVQTIRRVVRSSLNGRIIKDSRRPTRISVRRKKVAVRPESWFGHLTTINTTLTAGRTIDSSLTRTSPATRSHWTTPSIIERSHGKEYQKSCIRMSLWPKMVSIQQSYSNATWVTAISYQPSLQWPKPHLLLKTSSSKILRSTDTVSTRLLPIGKELSLR